MKYVFSFSVSIYFVPLIHDNLKADSEVIREILKYCKHPTVSTLRAGTIFT